MRTVAPSKNREGFTPVELPVALVIIAVLGLLGALFWRLLVGSLAWYGWLIGGLGATIVFLLILVAAAPFSERRKLRQMAGRKAVQKE